MTLKISWFWPYSCIHIENGSSNLVEAEFLPLEPCYFVKHLIKTVVSWLITDLCSVLSCVEWCQCRTQCHTSNRDHEAKEKVSPWFPETIQFLTSNDTHIEASGHDSNKKKKKNGVIESPYLLGFHIAQETLKFTMIDSFGSNVINKFWKNCNNIRHFQGFRTQILFVYQSMPCYQIAIRCILHIIGDKWRHATEPLGHTWGSIRHQSNSFCIGISRPCSKGKTFLAERINDPRFISSVSISKFSRRWRFEFQAS